MHADIIQRAFEVFRADAAAAPPMTLRAGSAADEYAELPAFDPALDEPTDASLEMYAFSGLAYLDAASWRHHLPRLIAYALRHIDSNAPGTVAIDGLLWSLRPPEREPPRLGSVSAAQEAVIVTFLDALAFDDNSAHQHLAMQVLEQMPNTPEEGAFISLKCVLSTSAARHSEASAWGRPAAAQGLSDSLSRKREGTVREAGLGTGHSPRRPRVPEAFADCRSGYQRP